MLAQSKRPHQRQFNYLTILQTESPSSICSMPTLCPSRLRRICRCRFWSQQGERRVCNLACAGTPMCDPSTGTFQPAGHSFVQAGFCVWCMVMVLHPVHADIHVIYCFLFVLLFALTSSFLTCMRLVVVVGKRVYSHVLDHFILMRCAPSATVPPCLISSH